ncbi:MAG: PilZ domain-containing protein [Desulfocapsaceae bacterium]
MAHGEKRKYIRWDSIHLLDYVVLEPDGSRGRYSMGRTLDVSLNGVKLETVYRLPIDTELEITVGIEHDLIDLIGRVTHTNIRGGRYVSGVEFVKMSAEGRRIFRLYTDAFKKHREESLPAD